MVDQIHHNNTQQFHRKTRGRPADYTILLDQPRMTDIGLLLRHTPCSSQMSADQHLKASRSFASDKAYIDHLTAEKKAGRYTGSVPKSSTLRTWRSRARDKETPGAANS